MGVVGTAVTVTSPVPREIWATLARAHPRVVTAQTLHWRDAVMASAKYHDRSLLYSFSSGRQVLLPLAGPRRLPEWASELSSWPLGWGPAGPLSTDGRVTAEEAATVLDDVARRGTLGVELKLNFAADETWLQAGCRSHPKFDHKAYGNYVLHLDGGFDEVWKNRFKGTARTAMRKAERSGVEIERDTSGAFLPVYLDLYEKAVQHRVAAYGEPLWLSRIRQGRVGSRPERLALVVRQLGDSCAIWVARVHGRPVAAAIVISTGAYATYWRGVMDKDQSTRSRANDLLHRAVIEHACCEGRRFYDMGEAEPGTPLGSFKEKLGAVPYRNHQLIRERLPLRTKRAATVYAGKAVRKVTGARAM